MNDTRTTEALREAIETQTGDPCPFSTAKLEELADLIGEDYSATNVEAALDEMGVDLLSHVWDSRTTDFIASHLADALCGHPD